MPSAQVLRLRIGSLWLVDHVLPEVPVRQWVLTVPHRIRYLLAWRHDLCRTVARILYRTVERHLRARAREHGVRDGRGGGVAVLQRFGGSLLMRRVFEVDVLACPGATAACGSSLSSKRPR